MSNNYGFYSLILPPGKVRLRASYVGFKAMEIEIDLQRDTMIDFPLRSLASLGEVVIRGTRPRYEILSSRAGVIDVPAERARFAGGGGSGEDLTAVAGRGGRHRGNDRLVCSWGRGR